MSKQFSVRAARCHHMASTEEVYETLVRITEPLQRTWDRLGKASRIALKFNMMMEPHGIHYFAGRRRELVDDAVARAVLRLLRERTTADLVAVDSFGCSKPGVPDDNLNYLPLLQEFDVDYAESNLAPFASYEVPGGGLMFDRYTLNAAFKEADEVVSVAKMKNHGFMGITLCMKNFFGLPPTIHPEGRVRTYFHHAIRLSYVLPDLGKILDPCLNVIDGLTGQWGCEWGGEGRIGDALIAGDQVTATDACGTWLMGIDPQSDWPQPPFRRDRNHLLVAAENGFGTVDLDDIDFVSEVEPPLSDFDSIQYDAPEIMAAVRQTACEQGLLYRDRQGDMVDRYGGNYIYQQDGEVVWEGPDPTHLRSHREFGSNSKPGSAFWLKKVDADEIEGEQFGVYEDCLQRMGA